MERKKQRIEELDERQLEQIAAGADRFDQDLGEKDFDWRKSRRGAGNGNETVVK